MLVTEMFDRVILKSGQFILAKSKIEIDIDSFRLLVEDALAQYSKHNPATKRYQIYVSYPRQFTFDEFLLYAVSLPIRKV